ncbi:hypothetical protein JG688_00016193 [Phytophthora aleatoria]|uniref:Methyltransferase domain-containing protein n=1 Tax=Phytophthora aleatoria TaxID=2496075 RepID=A0A8J5LWD0_9STRA|nr:hypothetical protein JG688_00016193 [Phytophthora aleatoria]
MAQHVARATQTWQPQEYLKFQRQRLRPALELLARVSELPTTHDDSVEIIDLGAGTGNMAPSILGGPTHVTFVDSSASMLAVAQQEHDENEALDTQRFAYVQADFGTYRARTTRGLDILERGAAPGGVLAFQIPDTRLQSSHQRMVDAAADLGLSDRVAGVRWVTCEKDPSFYYELFKAVDSGAELDMWAAVYAQILEGDNPVADFTGSTAIRP